MGGGNPQETGSSARCEFMFQLPSCLCKETGGERKMAGELALSCQEIKTRLWNSGIVDKTPGIEKRVEKGNNHICQALLKNR